jgi:putative transposase
MREKPDTPVDAHWRTPDALWPHFQKVLPTPQPKPKGGRPRMDDRQALDAIFSVLRTGCQWKALPRSLGAGSTVHDRFQEWQRAGVFEQLWKPGLLQYDAAIGIDWEWQAMDGAMTKAPLGGKRNWPQPHRPRQERHQTQSVDRGGGDPLGFGGGGGQSSGYEVGEGDAGVPPG